MYFDARAVESAQSLEMYITVVPTPGASSEDQAREVFSEVKRVLSESGARLLQERVFASEGAMEVIPAIRSEIYGDLDDGVPPSWLLAPPTDSGEVAGVQVHALKSEYAARVLHLAG